MTLNDILQMKHSLDSYHSMNVLPLQQVTIPQQVVSSEPRVFDIVRLWSRGMKEAAKALTSSRSRDQGMPIQQNSYSDIEQKKLSFNEGNNLS